MSLYQRLARGGLTGTLILAMMLPLAVQAQSRSVVIVVNGRVVTFDQPPIDRAGRVFVPLRGVFQDLGASVVYANGQINASGNGRNVHLQIGSTQATVNGQPVYMDVAPFVIGARTLVPLRFVAQALGATVQWDEANYTVYIRGHAGAAPSNMPPGSTLRLENQHPAPGATVRTTHPAIHATFSQPVRRNALNVSVDGRDVTPSVYANPNGFNVTANFELYAGTHRVTVSGTTVSGATFSRSWTFYTQAGAAANFINRFSPSPGSRVGGSFTISGHTLPNSRIHIVATGESTALGGLLQIGTGTFQTDVQADGNGNFSAPVALNAVSGGQVRVILTSTSPGGASIERQIIYST